MDSIEEELFAFIDRITVARENLKKANTEVRALLKPEEMQKEFEAIAEYDDKAVAITARLRQRLLKLREYQNRINNIPSSDSLAQPLGMQSKYSNSAKLPKLILKSFSGDIKDWTPFWERFRSSVHVRTDLSGADKFNYLQKHLTGRAADSIAGFIPSDSNYDAAISMLQEEYGDKEKLIDHSIQQLMELPKVSSRRDIVGLRRLYNSATASTRSLTALGLPPSQYSAILKSIILRCMPTELVIDFHRATDNEDHQGEEKINAKIEVTDKEEMASTQSECGSSYTYGGDEQVKSILKYLKREVESLEKSMQTTSPTSTSTSTRANRTSFHGGNGRPYKTAAGLLTPTVHQKCYFCKSLSHTTQQCNAPHSISQRKEMLKRDGRCFRCTRRGHGSRNCLIRNISCEKCKGHHATSLCDPNFFAKPTIKQSVKYSENQTAERNAKDKSEITSQMTTNLCSPSAQNSSDVYLQTACVLASSTDIYKKKSVFIRIIIDGGSQRSYIRQSVADKLGLQIIDKVDIRIFSFGCSKTIPTKAFDRVRVVLKSQYDDQLVTILAIVVPEICLDIIPTPPVDCPALSRYVLADDHRSGYLEPGISVLIGADYFWSIVRHSSQQIYENLTAIDSIFGWTLQGPATDSFCENLVLSTSATVTLQACVLDDVDLKNFWDLETVGIKSNISEETINEHFDKYITKNNNRYECSLLWKSVDCVLDSYFSGARQRLSKLVQRMSREPSKLLEYDREMWNFITRGIAERVEEGLTTASRVYYMPHRAIYREDKATTKTRIVFDASANSGNSLSLNSQLLSGPNLIPDVMYMLLNFRIGKIGLVADIEKAFLQISLSKEDRDVHRFLWFNERITDTTKLPELATYRMTRLTFGVACSPFLLCATLKKHFQREHEKYPETCEMLSNSFYMDDLVVSVDSYDFAYRFYKETCTILQGACMNIRKWNSNNFQLRQHFKEVDNVQKVLGIKWYCLSDEITVDLQELSNMPSTIWTKRKVLQFIAKIFDPLGLIGPFTIKLKILFQDLWRLRCDWDEAIPSKLQTSWDICLSDMPILMDLTIPRYVFVSHNIINRQLHVFCDASPKAYGAVSYVRSENEEGSIKVMYVCSKSRVAPLKGEKGGDLTIPRLELTAALIAARLSNYIYKQLSTSFDSRNIWSDSKIALHWINNERHKYQYVTQRVQEIRQITTPSDWRYCPSETNPADLLTRGITGRNLVSSSMWIEGPSWLSHHFDTWPKFNFDDNCLQDSLCLQASAEPAKTISTSSILRIEDFSNYRRLLRVTAYVLRFTDSLKKKPAPNKYLIARELERAENLWIKYIQSQQYPEEVALLRRKDAVPQSSKILTLNPVMDEEGIIRLGSRLENSDLTFNESFPIIIPKSTHLTTIIIADMHLRTLHGGVNIVLTRLREKFWIIRGRQKIKAVINNCTICKRLRGKPISQPFAPLPRNRLTTTRPFETTGIDFAGPLYVRISSDEVKTKKVYILLFTCAVVRAVHLELVSDLSTPSCILALRRFFSRRGIPKTIISDNAKTFKRASLEFRQLSTSVCSEEVQDYISNQGVAWEFIVERAAWWGGFWERLIKTVKDILKATIGRAVLGVDQLQTFLMEAESVINARPLTYVNEDPLDLTPLTPAHFLTGSIPTVISLTPANVSDSDIRFLWRTRLKLTNSISKRFKTEYLQRLRSAHNTNHSFSSNVRIGDVVIVHDGLTPRILWKLAVIENVFPGRDGRVRACLLRLHNGSRMRRAVQHLYSLEVLDSSPAGGC